MLNKNVGGFKAMHALGIGVGLGRTSLGRKCQGRALEGMVVGNSLCGLVVVFASDVGEQLWCFFREALNHDGGHCSELFHPDGNVPR